MVRGTEVYRESKFEIRNLIIPTFTYPIGKDTAGCMPLFMGYGITGYGIRFSF